MTLSEKEQSGIPLAHFEAMVSLTPKFERDTL